MSDFIDDKCELHCVFTDAAGEEVELSKTISKDIQLTFLESAKVYQYDDNKIEAYRQHVGYGEELGTPWNFVETSHSEILKAKVSKARGVKAVTDINSSSPSLNITPQALNEQNEDVRFHYAGAGHNVIEVKGCHESNPELLIYTENPKTFPVEFYKVCETDDDLQLIDQGTSVQSENEVCIDGGYDGSIDLMYRDGFIPEDPLSGDKLDRVEFNNLLRTFQVLAGTNLICDTKAKRNSDPKCPSVFTDSDFLNDANGIFEKVAIEASREGYIQTIYVNYDVINDDGVMDYEIEQNHLHITRELIDEHLADGVMEVHVVRSMGDEILPTGETKKYKGKAIPDIGFNFVALDRSYGNGRTLAHEMGHAKWSLIHPGCPCDGANTGEFNVDDPDNFMDGDDSGVKIRRYQFDKMHN